MENPYQTPAPTDDRSYAGDTAGARPTRLRGLVGHVRVVAVLMIIQGVLELLLGGTLLVMSVMVPWMVASGTPREVSNPRAMWALLIALYVGMSAVNLVAAGLHIYGGIRLYQFQSRTLGMVALSVGMATIMTFYCGPTAIALGVYGLIVLLNPEVGQAFAWRGEGLSSRDILAGSAGSR